MFELRPYQQQGVDDIYRHLRSGTRRVVYQARTGLGKTLVISRILHDACVKRGRRGLFLAHRFELEQQLSNKLTQFGVPHSLVVSGYDRDHGATCNVASVQTLATGKHAMPEADVIVVDECHRQDADKVLAQYPHAIVVGLTATPVINTAGGKPKSLFGKYDALVTAPITFAEACANGYLVPFRCISTPPPDLSALASSTGADYAQRTVSDLMSQDKIVGDVVTHWVRHAQQRPTIVFAASLEHAEKLRVAFEQAGHTMPVVRGDMSADDRSDALEALRNGTVPGVISVSVLCEGVDIPRVSCVVLARITRSLVVYLQSVGRGCRPCPDEGKTDCLVIDHGANIPRLGPPGMDRDWPWGENKKPRKTGESFSLWRCQYCYCVAEEPPTDECPVCGEPIDSRSRRVKLVDGNLVEYDDATMRQLEQAHKQAAAEIEQAAAEHAAEKAQNAKRIKTLFGIAYKRGYRGNSAKRFAMRYFGNYQQSGMTWEAYINAMQRCL